MQGATVSPTGAANILNPDPLITYSASNATVTITLSASRDIDVVAIQRTVTTNAFSCTLRINGNDTTMSGNKGEHFIYAKVNETSRTIQLRGLTGTIGGLFVGTWFSNTVLPVFGSSAEVDPERNPTRQSRFFNSTPVSRQGEVRWNRLTDEEARALYHNMDISVRENQLIFVSPFHGTTREKQSAFMGPVGSFRAPKRIAPGRSSATIAAVESVPFSTTIAAEVVNKPSTPGTPAASGVSSTSMTWTWTRSTGIVSRYEIRWRVQNGTWSNWINNGTSLTFFLDNLTANTTYEVQVRANNSAGDSGVASASQATNNVAATPQISLSETTLSIAEGGTGTFNVRLTASGTKRVSFASNNADVTLSPTSVNFTPQNFSQNVQITVSARQDADTANDSATITASGPGMTNKTIAVTVVDDDATSTPPVISIEKVADITEGANAEFMVSSSVAAPAGGITVSLTVTATGAMIIASQLGTKTVVISQGDTSATFQVATVSDTTDEDDGTVTVTITDETHYNVSPTKGSDTIDIADDDDEDDGSVPEISVFNVGSPIVRNPVAGQRVAFEIASNKKVTADLIVRIQLTESSNTNANVTSEFTTRKTENAIIVSGKDAVTRAVVLAGTIDNFATLSCEAFTRQGNQYTVSNDFNAAHFTFTVGTGGAEGEEDAPFLTYVNIPTQTETLDSTADSHTIQLETHYGYENSGYGPYNPIYIDYFYQAILPDNELGIKHHGSQTIYPRDVAPTIILDYVDSSALGYRLELVSGGGYVLGMDYVYSETFTGI